MGYLFVFVVFLLMASPLILWGCWMRASGDKDAGNGLIGLSVATVVVGFILGLI